MKLAEREKHYYTKFNIHPYTLIHLHDFTAQVLATDRYNETLARRAETVAKMLALLGKVEEQELLEKYGEVTEEKKKKTARLPWHYQVPVMVGFSHNLRHELTACKAFYRQQTQPVAMPSSMSRDKWVLRNLVPFFRSSRLLQARRPQLKRLSQEKDAELMSRHPDYAKIAQLEKEMRELQQDFKDVAWEEVARFISTVPGGNVLENRRPQKRQKVEARLQSEEPEEEIPRQRLKVEADRIKHLCRELENDLPMDSLLGDLLECHIKGAIPNGFPNPEALLATLH